MPLTDKQRSLILEYVLVSGLVKGMREDTELGEACENNEVTEDEICAYLDEIKEREASRLVLVEAPSNPFEIKKLVEELAELICSRCECMGSLTYDYGPDSGDTDAYDPDSTWTLRLGEAAAEMVGGAVDGAQVFSGIAVDVTNILKLLTPLECGVKFETVCVTFTNQLDEPPYVVIEGRYKGINMLIYIYAEPYTDEEPDTLTNEQGHIWQKPPKPDEDDNG